MGYLVRQNHGALVRFHGAEAWAGARPFLYLQHAISGKLYLCLSTIGSISCTVPLYSKVV